MKILIVRNDKLGDFILSLPCFAMIKACIPEATVVALVPNYTAELALNSEWIDEIIIDENLNTPLNDVLNLRKNLAKHNFDSVITIYSTTRVGIAAFLARIKYRLAPATKIAQIFYNHRLKQRRSRSEKPEFAYNLDLTRKFLFDHKIIDHSTQKIPYITFEPSIITQLKSEFCKINNINPNDKLVFVHAGSGGSANNLSLNQYAHLISRLESCTGHTTILTTGPGEESTAKKLSKILNNIPHVVYFSKEGLLRFTQHIAFADLFIAGSTGPLHIAGALNVPTAAFYTRRRSATPLRWQTLNTPDRRLAFTPPETADEMDMSQIDIDEAARIISKKFLKD